MTALPPADGYAVRVAPECGDVRPHPTKRGELIALREVFFVESRIMQEPQSAEPIVDVHDHHVAVRREGRAVVPGNVAASVAVRAAVQPQGHGTGAFDRRRRNTQR